MLRQLIFKLDEKQVVDALTTHYQKIKLQKSAFIRLFIIWFVCIAFLLAFLIILDGFDSVLLWSNALMKVALLYLCIIAIMWALQFFVFLPYFSRRYVKKHKALIFEQRWAWTENSITIQNAYMNGSYLLQHFHHWHEYNDYIALYMSAQKFNILPKNIMSLEQLQDIRAIFSREIQKSSHI